MTSNTEREIESSGVRLHLVEQGSGSLVVLLHGFPETSYSWRHQMPALANAGYHVVAPDQRGYGLSDCPAETAKYSQLHLVGDVITILDALNEQQAVVVGHDWGASVSWNTALLRPDRIRAVAALSVPYRPRGRFNLLQAMRMILGEGYYMVYFQDAGKADKELDQDVRSSMRRLLYWGAHNASPVIPAGKTLLEALPEPPELPSWLTAEDLETYAQAFERTGFTPGLNWYRTIELSWELLAPWNGALVTQPALYVAGEEDLVLNLPRVRAAVADMQSVVPNLRRTVLLPGCGHWTQQERPAEVNEALLRFLGSL